MPLYQINENRLELVPTTTFVEEGILERRDLQRLLKSEVSPLGDDLLVIAEEFGDWEESSRRIDILCIDKQARLVVVEIKRDDVSPHLELQAIRYAAMVSSMTLQQAIAAYARFLGGHEETPRSAREILEFLERDAPEEAELSGEVRIILVAADFSQELTTTVIWLNKQGLEISCVRLRPYKLGDKLMIDSSQIIPLPEAIDYEIKIRAQEKEKGKARTARQETFRRFWSLLIDRSRARTQLFVNRSTTTDHWLSAGIGRAGFTLGLSLTEDRARVECYIRQGKDSDERNLAAFNVLGAQREGIEKAFGGPLDWQDLPDRIGCRICVDLMGGWQTPEGDWPALQDRMIDAMINLEKALRLPIKQLTV